MRRERGGRAAGGEGFANAKTVTDLNFYVELAKKDCRAAFERLVFEDLAIQPEANLAETNPEKLFGIKNNATMRFLATGRYGNFAGVMASVPPEKRTAIYAVFDKLSLPLPETKRAAVSHYAKHISVRGVRGPNLVIGRILRHLPAIEGLIANGSLTEENIARTLFPDMPSRNWSLQGINEFTNHVDTLANQTFIDEGMDEMQASVIGGQVQLIMEETCCTLQEGIDAYKTGRRVAPPPYMTTATFELEKLDGTTKAGRDQLFSSSGGDLQRAYDYGPADDPARSR